MLNDKAIDPLVQLNHQLHLSTKAPYFKLSAAQKLNFFQYHCIDVLVCLIIIIWSAITVGFLLLRLCFAAW